MYDEKHFKPAKLAKLWNVSGDIIRSLAHKIFSRVFRRVPNKLSTG